MISDAKLNELFEKMDQNKSGGIEYSEFAVGAIQLAEAEGEDILKRTFAFFDKNKDGFISKQELKDTLKLGWMSSVQLDTILKDVDSNQDDKVIFLLCP